MPPTSSNATTNVNTANNGSPLTVLRVFRAESSDKIVTHKPFTLEICTRDIATHYTKLYTLPTKISERKIKRRENACSTVSRVWLDSNAANKTDGQSLSLSPDNHNRNQSDGGFMIYVETKGGLTTGRQKQRYLLLKRNAFYCLSTPLTTAATPVSAVPAAPSQPQPQSQPSIEILSVTLKSRSGDIMELQHWHPSQPPPPPMLHSSSTSPSNSSNESSGHTTPTAAAATTPSTVTQYKPRANTAAPTSTLGTKPKLTVHLPLDDSSVNAAAAASGSVPSPLPSWYARNNSATLNARQPTFGASSKAVQRPTSTASLQTKKPLAPSHPSYPYPQPSYPSYPTVSPLASPSSSSSSSATSTVASTSALPHLSSHSLAPHSASPHNYYNNNTNTFAMNTASTMYPSPYGPMTAMMNTVPVPPSTASSSATSSSAFAMPMPFVHNNTVHNNRAVAHPTTASFFPPPPYGGIGSFDPGLNNADDLTVPNASATNSSALNTHTGEMNEMDSGLLNLNAAELSMYNLNTKDVEFNELLHELMSHDNNNTHPNATRKMRVDDSDDLKDDNLLSGGWNDEFDILANNNNGLSTCTTSTAMVVPPPPSATAPIPIPPPKPPSSPALDGSQSPTTTSSDMSVVTSASLEAHRPHSPSSTNTSPTRSPLSTSPPNSATAVPALPPSNRPIAVAPPTRSVQPSFSMFTPPVSAGLSPNSPATSVTPLPPLVPRVQSCTSSSLSPPSSIASSDTPLSPDSGISLSSASKSLARKRKKAKSAKRRNKPAFTMTPRVWCVATRKAPFRCTIVSSGQRLDGNDGKVTVVWGGEVLPDTAIDCYARQLIVEVPVWNGPKDSAPTSASAGTDATNGGMSLKGVSAEIDVILKLNNETKWQTTFVYRLGSEAANTESSDAKDNGGDDDDSDDDDDDDDRGDDDDDSKKDKSDKADTHKRLKNNGGAPVRLYASFDSLSAFKGYFKAAPALESGFQSLLQRYLAGDFAAAINLPLNPNNSQRANSNQTDPEAARVQAMRQLFFWSLQTPDKQRAFVHRAVRDICRYMIAARNLNTRDKYGFGIIHYVTALGFVDCLNLLCGNKVGERADVNLLSTHSTAALPYTPWQLAQSREADVPIDKRMLTRILTKAGAKPVVGATLQLQCGGVSGSEDDKQRSSVSPFLSPNTITKHQFNANRTVLRWGDQTDTQSDSGSDGGSSGLDQTPQQSSSSLSASSQSPAQPKSLLQTPPLTPPKVLHPSFGSPPGGADLTTRNVAVQLSNYNQMSDIDPHTDQLPTGTTTFGRVNSVPIEPMQSNHTVQHTIRSSCPPSPTLQQFGGQPNFTRFQQPFNSQSSHTPRLQGDGVTQPQTQNRRVQGHSRGIGMDDGGGDGGGNAGGGGGCLPPLRMVQQPLRHSSSQQNFNQSSKDASQNAAEFALFLTTLNAVTNANIGGGAQPTQLPSRPHSSHQSSDFDATTTTSHSQPQPQQPTDSSGGKQMRCGDGSAAISMTNDSNQTTVRQFGQRYSQQSSVQDKGDSLQTHRQPSRSETRNGGVLHAGSGAVGGGQENGFSVNGDQRFLQSVAPTVRADPLSSPAAHTAQLLTGTPQQSGTSTQKMDTSVTNTVITMESNVIVSTVDTIPAPTGAFLKQEYHIESQQTRRQTLQNGDGAARPEQERGGPASAFSPSVNQQTSEETVRSRCQQSSSQPFPLQFGCAVSSTPTMQSSFHTDNGVDSSRTTHFHPNDAKSQKPNKNNTNEFYIDYCPSNVVCLNESLSHTPTTHTNVTHSTPQPLDRKAAARSEPSSFLSSQPSSQPTASLSANQCGPQHSTRLAESDSQSRFTVSQSVVRPLPLAATISTSAPMQTTQPSQLQLRSLPLQCGSGSGGGGTAATALLPVHPFAITAAQSAALRGQSNRRFFTAASKSVPTQPSVQSNPLIHTAPISAFVRPTAIDMNGDGSTRCQQSVSGVVLNDSAAVPVKPPSSQRIRQINVSTAVQRKQHLLNVLLSSKLQRLAARQQKADRRSEQRKAAKEANKQSGLLKKKQNNGGHVENEEVNKEMSDENEESVYASSQRLSLMRLAENDNEIQGLEAPSKTTADDESAILALAAVAAMAEAAVVTADKPLLVAPNPNTIIPKTLTAQSNPTDVGMAGGVPSSHTLSHKRAMSLTASVTPKAPVSLSASGSASAAVLSSPSSSALCVPSGSLDVNKTGHSRIQNPNAGATFPPVTGGEGERVALLVGVNQYSIAGVPALKGCVNDVQRMRRVLVSRLRFSDPSVRLVTDEQATRERVLKEMVQIANASSNGDMIVLYFASHATREAIIVYDNQIYLYELNVIFSHSKTPYVLFYFDTCLSNAIPTAAAMGATARGADTSPLTTSTFLSSVPIAANAAVSGADYKTYTTSSFCGINHQNGGGPFNVRGCILPLSLFGDEQSKGGPGFESVGGQSEGVIVFPLTARTDGDANDDGNVGMGKIEAAFAYLFHATKSSKSLDLRVDNRSINAGMDAPQQFDVRTAAVYECDTEPVIGNVVGAGAPASAPSLSSSSLSSSSHTLLVTTACAPNQHAREHCHPTLGWTGAFTNALCDEIEALYDAADSDLRSSSPNCPSLSPKGVSPLSSSKFTFARFLTPITAAAAASVTALAKAVRPTALDCSPYAVSAVAATVELSDGDDRVLACRTMLKSRSQSLIASSQNPSSPRSPRTVRAVIHVCYSSLQTVLPSDVMTLLLSYVVARSMLTDRITVRSNAETSAEVAVDALRAVFDRVASKVHSESGGAQSPQTAIWNPIIAPLPQRMKDGERSLTFASPAWPYAQITAAAATVSIAPSTLDVSAGAPSLTAAAKSGVVSQLSTSFPLTPPTTFLGYEETRHDTPSLSTRNNTPVCSGLESKPATKSSTMCQGTTDVNNNSFQRGVGLFGRLMSMVATMCVILAVLLAGVTSWFSSLNQQTNDVNGVIVNGGVSPSSVPSTVWLDEQRKPQTVLSSEAIGAGFVSGNTVNADVSNGGALPSLESTISHIPGTEGPPPVVQKTSAKQHNANKKRGSTRTKKVRSLASPTIVPSKSEPTSNLSGGTTLPPLIPSVDSDESSSRFEPHRSFEEIGRKKNHTHTHPHNGNPFIDGSVMAEPLPLLKDRPSASTTASTVASADNVKGSQTVYPVSNAPARRVAATVHTHNDSQTVHSVGDLPTSVERPDEAAPNSGNPGAPCSSAINTVRVH